MRPLTWWRGSTLLVAGLLLVVPAMLLLQQQEHTERALLDLAQARLISVDGLAASAVDGEVRGAADALTATGRRTELRTALGPRRDVETVQEALAGLRRSFASMPATYGLDARGRLLVSDPPQPELYGQDFSYRDWFRGAVAVRGAYVSEGFRARALDQPLAIGIATAVRSDSGEVLGVVGSLYRLDRLQELVDDHGSAQGLSTTVVDRSGQVVARTGGVPLALRRTGDPRLLETTGRGVRTGSTDGRRGVVWAATDVPSTGGAVLVEVPRAVALADLPARHRDTRVVLWLLLGLAFVATSLALALEVRRRRAQAGLTAAHHELARRQAYSDALLDSVDTGLVGVDAAGRLLLSNPAATALGLDDRPARSALHGRPVEGEQRLGGREVVVQAHLVVAADGEVLGAFAAATDRTTERALVRRLTTQSAQLAEAARLARVGSFSVDPASMAFTFDESLFTLWGVPAGHPLREDPRVFAEHVLLAEDRPHVRAAFDAGLAHGGRHEVSFRIRRLDDGQLRHVRSDVDVVLGDDGAPVRIIGTQVDVTELVVARHDAREAEAFYRAVLAASPDITVLVDQLTGAPAFASAGVAQVLGHSPEQLVALGDALISRLVHPADLGAVQAAHVAVAATADGQVTQSRFRCLDADGAWRWLSMRSTPFDRGADGQVLRSLGVLRDVTELVAAEVSLQQAALHDALTGLPNRALLADRVAAALERTRATGREAALLYLDLDGFKHVNDTAGHAAGDAVLLAVAERLRAVVRPQDTVARIGGDEFVVLLEPWDRDLPRTADDDRAAALSVADRVGEVVRAPVRVGAAEHVVTASTGVAFSGTTLSGSQAAEQLLRDADAAMYEAKHGGRDRREVFHAGLRADLEQRGRVEQLLRRTLSPSALLPAPRRAPSAEAFSAAFQPVFRQSGELLAFEALARLQDDQGVPVRPDLFISVAEQTGLIRLVGRSMLELALAQLARWRRESPGAEHLRMAVNLSAHEVRDPAFADETLACLAGHGLAPTALILELTETVLLEAGPASLSVLRRLRDAGVSIAIDDFGTGYASLRYLAELPVTAVKVDARFTRGLPHDTTSAQIVRAIAGLADDLGLACVVEGVETEQQRAALPDGVLLQGYLLGRPAPGADLGLVELQRRALGHCASC